MVTESSARGDHFYLIVHSDPPTFRDFESAELLGKPLLDRRYEREWRGAVSVYNDVDHAIQKAREYRGNLGAYVTRIAVSTASEVEVRQTTRDRRHFSVYGEASDLLPLVVGPTVSIRGRR